ncbi:MAG TPA: hypothetical protein VNT32_13745 [Thermoleophilaceae bacterium]|nr:hypothetical protein [Thermoleophilaceae bacterium]
MRPSTCGSRSDSSRRRSPTTGAYTGEVDELIADNERMADEARAAWVAGQAALTR